MHILIEAVDQGVRPRERLLKIPFNHDVRPPSKVIAYPIKDGAPDEFPPEDAIDFCDTSVQKVSKFDRVAVFFTPAINLDPPLAGKHFLWQVETPGQRRFRRGEARFDPKSGGVEMSLPFAKQGSPGIFALVHDYTFSGAPAGEFLLKTTPAIEMSNGLFGLGEGSFLAPFSDSVTGEDSYWQEEGTFELQDARLHFQGFFLEESTDKKLQDARLIDGTVTVEDESVDNRVRLAARAEWVWAEVKDGGRAPRGPAGRVESELVLEFPQELDPGKRVLGEIQATARLPADIDALHRSARGFDGDHEVRTFTYGIHPFVPTNKGPPGRHLVVDERAEPWGVLEVAGSKLKRGDPSNLFAQGRGGEKTRKVRIYRGRPESVSGLPPRHFAWHLRDEKTLWVLPVSVVFTNVHTDSWDDTSVFTAWGFAVYGAAPGTYPFPRPSNGEGDVVRRGGGAGGDGEKPAGRTLDPNDPDLAGFITEWVAAAEPLENALYGADLRYNDWGIKVGITATGRTVVRSRPDAAVGQTSPEFLWGTGRSLESVDHCTLGEYVTARLENRSVAHCRGRYRRVGDTPVVGSDAGQLERSEGDRETLGQEAVDGLIEDADSDTVAPPRVHRTQNELGLRPDPHGPEIDALRDRIRTGDRDGAVEILTEITGGTADGGGDLIDRLLDESGAEQEFGDQSRFLDEAFGGEPLPGDEEFISAVGLDPGAVTGDVAPVTIASGPTPEELVAPPVRERDSDDPFVRDRNTADGVISGVVEEQARSVERERSVARQEILNFPIPTRGGMIGVDVGAGTSVVVTVWDRDQQDGDRVKISVGGRIVAEDLLLTNAKQSFSLSLHDLFTPITVIAHNEGSVNANTAVLEVTGGGKTLTSSWELKANEMGSTLIRRLP